jgi:hypothetical protein
LIEVPRPQIRTFPRPHIELAARFGRCGVDARLREPLHALGALVLIDDLNSMIARVENFLDEGDHDLILVVAAVEKGADMTPAIQDRSC